MARFGIIPPEPPRITSLDDCAPAFDSLAVTLTAKLTADGWDPVLYETLRTPERQHWLHGFGRVYDDGRGVVTHVDDPTHGYHVFGLAADIISASSGWDDPAFFVALGEAADALGLAWGGHWQMRDLPHVQFGGMDATPGDDIRALYASGGNEAIWSQVGAA